MLGVQIDPELRAQDLALGGQQQVEIIKALWRGSRVLILDEPTSMLTPQAVRELQSVLQRLKRHGLAIVFITHKLHEAVALGDRISVLRAGRLTGAIEKERISSSTPAELEAEIVGTPPRTPRWRSRSSTLMPVATVPSRGSRTCRCGCTSARCLASPALTATGSGHSPRRSAASAD
jgi:ABC-type uncharacterized transport system ATPase subunit